MRCRSTSPLIDCPDAVVQLAPNVTVWPTETLAGAVSTKSRAFDEFDGSAATAPAGASSAGAGGATTWASVAVSVGEVPEPSPSPVTPATANTTATATATIPAPAVTRYFMCLFSTISDVYLPRPGALMAVGRRRSHHRSIG